MRSLRALPIKQKVCMRLLRHFYSTEFGEGTLLYPKWIGRQP